MSNYFNPRSREGSDTPPIVVLFAAGNFNPRSREGSDVKQMTLIEDLSTISIHAPARGATPYLSPPHTSNKFQSTLPRGERPSFSGVSNSSYTYFNPRSREGSDSSFLVLRFRPVPISIHAPARGATIYNKLVELNANISIHAPARGATQRDSR